jgi:ELWxxDGT repeat protein
VVPSVTMPGQFESASTPATLAAFGSRILFGACDGSEFDAWVSDGTERGTQPLGVGTPPYCGLSPREFLAHQGAGFFLHEGKLWRTDGSAAGTEQLLDDGSGGFNNASLLALGERLVWLAEGNAGIRVITSEGTIATTRIAAELPLRHLRNSTMVDGKIYFAASGTDADGYGTDELWVTDGTAAGSQRILRPSYSNVVTAEFARLGNSTYLLTSSQLWRTDATPAGTHKVFEATDLARASGLTAWQDSLFFTAAVGSQFPQERWLFRSNGTALGTVPLARVGPETYGYQVTILTPLGNSLYFRGSDPAHGEELWATDGTAAGTRRVADIAPGAASSSPRGITAAGGRLFFAADDGEHGFEPWQSDGTAAGTRLVADLAPLGFSSDPAEFTAAAGLLYFRADDGARGAELWAHPLAP